MKKDRRKVGLKQKEEDLAKRKYKCLWKRMYF